jgi:hypothetical protein
LSRKIYNLFYHLFGTILIAMSFGLHHQLLFCSKITFLYARRDPTTDICSEYLGQGKHVQSATILAHNPNNR